jgi:hypothetical protein
MRKIVIGTTIQPLTDAEYVVVLPAPLHGVAGGERDRVRHVALPLIDVASDVRPHDVDVDVAGEHAVLVPDHRRTGGHANVGELREGNLRSRRRGHEDALEALESVAALPGVADAHGVALAALHRGGDRLAADRGSDDLLGLPDGQSVAGKSVSLQLEFEEVASRGALGVDAPGPRERAQRRFDFGADPLDSGDVRAEDLHADRSADPRREHVDPVLDRHRPGVRHARKAEPGVDLGGELVAGHRVGPEAAKRGAEQARPVLVEAGNAPPFGMRLEEDRRLDHRERCRVRRGLCAAGLPEDPDDLRDAGDEAVGRLEQPLGPRHSQAWEGRRHVQERPLLERRIELGAEAQIDGDRGRDQRRRDQDRRPGEAEDEPADRLVGGEEDAAELSW